MSIAIVIRCRDHNRTKKRPLDILQVARDDDEKLVSRHLTEGSKEVVKGPWQYEAKPFKKGLYCQHCLNAGNRSPLPVDEEDFHELGLADRPIVFIDPKSFQAEATAQRLKEKFTSVRHYTELLPAVAAHYGSDDVLNKLIPELRTAIRKHIIGEDGHLYHFQTEAIQSALDGHDVVVTTPTASGKSLSYIVPIFDSLLREPNATALYLSPLVALTEDQLDSLTKLDSSGIDWEAKGERFSHYRVCRKLELGSRSITIARYDGQVAPGDREHIRRTRPQYVLTTPDMLHIALLNGAFQEKQWAYLFAGLKYVVIDELHTYKGVFGASFANLMRRLMRVCREHGSAPVFLSASATIREPEATVEKLIGRRPILVDGGESGAPRKPRVFVLWSNEVDHDTRALSTQAKDVLLFALREQRIRTIAFGRSISEINDIYRFVMAELGEIDSNKNTITPFMRELRSDEKRQIIRNLKTGTIHGVISTTALSMGVDIGNLSAAVIIGFPGSIAVLWQQAGRAGRAGEGLVILIADSNPLDQFFVNHPDVLFNLSAEPIYCNPDNPHIVKGHLLCAARELPLQENEIEAFGSSAQDTVKELVGTGELIYEDSGGLILSESVRQNFEGIPLRNLSFAINVTREDNHELIVQVDAARAQRALHRYAHYQYLNRYFEVTRFNVDFASQRGEILVKELEKPEYTTTARIEREVCVKQQLLHQPFPSFHLYFGRVCSRTNVVGYYRVPLFTRNEPFKYQPLGIAAPDSYTYDTHALWITSSSSLLTPFTSEEQEAGLYSLTEAVRLAIAVEELCDPSDLVSVSTACHPDTQPMIMVHDATPGGIGITESAYSKARQVLERALLILDECPYCSAHPESRGCPYCVTAQYGDESTINRHVAIEIARALL